MAVSVCDVHTDAASRDTTAYSSVSFPLACFEDDMRLITVPVHWHDEYELLAATAGQVTVTLDTDELVLREGDAVFINAGCLHAVRSVTEGVSVLRSVVFHPRLIAGSSDSCFHEQLVLPFSRPSAPDYLLLRADENGPQAPAAEALLCWSAVRDDVFDYENEARYRLSRMLRLLTALEPPENASRRRDTPTVARVKKALAYIDRHYMEEIGNDTLTALCACSESVLLRDFRRTVGVTPMQYVLRYRLDRAAALLVSTEDRSGDIAAACGFNDLSYFTRLFRRATGLTPVAYRKAHASAD